jgi:hypothetical protein
MTIDLHDGGTDFAIANGDDRTLQVLGDESVDMQQQTQVTTLSRDDAPTAFPEHAVRSVSLSYAVAFPACASLEDALMQSRLIQAQCPKGGVLKEYHAGVRITYAQAWINRISTDRTGVSNRFTFSLTAVRPTAEELVLDSDGEIFTDGEDDEEFTY